MSHIFDLEADLNFFYPNTTVSREQVVKIIAYKLHVLGDKEKIMEYFEYLFTNEKERVLFGYNKGLALEIFFQDLRIFSSNLPEVKEGSKIQLLKLLAALYNSAFCMYRGRYYQTHNEPELITEDYIHLTKEEVEEGDELLVPFLFLVHQNKEIKHVNTFGEGNALPFIEVKKRTGIKDNRTILKYLAELNLEHTTRNGKNFLSEEHTEKLKIYNNKKPEL